MPAAAMLSQPGWSQDASLSFGRAASVPITGLERMTLEPRSGSTCLDSEDDVSGRSIQSLNLERAPSYNYRKTIASLYRTSRSTSGDLWEKSSTISDTVCERHAIRRVKDLCGSDHAIYIDGDALKHVKQLGAGSFAEVSIAEYCGPQGIDPPIQVAVKRLKVPNMGSDEDVLDFIEEVRVLHRLSAHTCIVNFIGFGCLDTSSREAEYRTLFVAQQYMELGTLKSLILKQMINRQKVYYTNAQALSWAIDITCGLASMHTADPMVIHRDLKAENILLTASEGPTIKAKIADLGLHATVPSGHSPSASVNLDELEASLGESSRISISMDTPFAASGGTYTRAKQYKVEPIRSIQAGYEESTIDTEALYKMTGNVGSYCYMAPEVMTHKSYNEKVDVFSLGVIMFELFSRRLCSADYMNTTEWDESELHAQKVAAGWRPPFPAAFPGEMKTLVNDCWAGLPELRPTMLQVLERLEKIKESGVMDVLDEAQAQANGCCTIM